jgi:hypothetical protein
MIEEDRLQKALTYLAETDATCAELKADVARKEYLLERAEARAYLLASGATVKVRESNAVCSDIVTQAQDAHVASVVAYEAVRAKRTTEALVVEVWRSLNVNRRMGNV